MSSGTTSATNVPQSALNIFILKNGGNKADVDQINNLMNLLMERASIKIDEDGDRVNPMRKLEIKFYELFEKRTEMMKTHGAEIAKRELELKNLASKAKIEQKRANEIELQRLKQDKIEKTNQARNPSLFFKGRRDYRRSKKPVFNHKVVVKEVINQDVADMLKFLGIILPTEPATLAIT